MSQKQTDEVDRIVASWQQALPDEDFSPLAVFSRIKRLGRQLDLARRHAFSQFNLETWEFDVLSALRRAGEPYQLSPSQLVAETLVTSGTMTNRIDRLASNNLVVRKPSPADRRGVLVELTETGRQRVDDAIRELLRIETDFLTSLEPAAIAELAGLLRTVATKFE